MSVPLHVKATKDDIAERVVLAGDPARVVQLSKELKDAELVNKNRGYLIYTGYYGRARVSVACHGIGGPSIALLVEELLMLGAKSFVRLGSTGALVGGMKIGEAVIATGAVYGGGTLGQYVPDAHIAPVPNFDLTTQLVKGAEEEKLTFYVGPVFSSDAFHAEDSGWVERWASRGCLAVEMECAVLFGLGLLRKFKAGSMLLVSDNLADGTHLFDAKKLRPYMLKCSGAVFKAITRTSV